MLTAIGDFLKTTFGETLKRPLQPAGMVVAAIWLLLNALFIYPLLLDQGFPAVIIIRDAGAVWLAVLSVASVLILAYILVSLSGSILGVMTGEAWVHSYLLGPFWVKRNQSKLLSLKKELWLPTGDLIDHPTRQRSVRRRLATAFPTERSALLPTALGNALGATTSYVRNRYGIDLAALWPEMEIAIADEPVLSARLADEKATLDFLVNLSFMLILLAFEYALIRFLQRDWQSIASIIFLLAAWGVYRVAVDKARAWGDTVQLAFDLHRDKLRTRPGMRGFIDLADEQRAWRQASRWVLWGEQPADLLSYGSHATPGSKAPDPSVMTSPHVRAALTHALGERWDDGDAGGRRWYRSTRYAQYVLLVSSFDAVADRPLSAAMEGIQLIVRDPRIPQIKRAPRTIQEAEEAESDNPWHSELIPTGEPVPSTAVLWRRDQMPANSSTILHYQVPISQVRITPSHKSISVIMDQSGVEHDSRRGTAVVTGAVVLQNTGLDPLSKVILRIEDDCLAERPAVLIALQVGLADGRPRGIVGNQTGRLYELHLHPLADDRKPFTVRYIALQREAAVDMDWLEKPISANDSEEERARREKERELDMMDPTIDPAAATASRLSMLRLLEPSPLSIYRPDGTATDIRDDLLKSPVTAVRAAWAILALEHNGRNRDEVLLNNLGCAWALLQDWLAAEMAFRNALELDITRFNSNNVGRGMQAKQAADWNLQLIGQIRDD
jgi:hypothetical protein